MTYFLFPSPPHLEIDRLATSGNGVMTAVAIKKPKPVIYTLFNVEIACATLNIFLMASDIMQSKVAGPHLSEPADDYIHNGTT